MKFSVVAALLTFAVSGYAQSSASSSSSSNPGGIAITAPGQGVSIIIPSLLDQFIFALESDLHGNE